MTLFHADLLAVASFVAGWFAGHYRYRREIKAAAGTLDRLAVTGAIKQ